ncbi:MAG: hypothetical protein KKH34_00675, partial [Candidatus Omnitrophica bacterium]|nr:hypothetical protein [Candidatus Omnitrophota bacterium]
PDLLESIRPFDKKIRGEVSKNVLRRQRIAVKENWTSFIEEYGPWNYDVLLKADDRLDPGILRYEERREFLPGLYLATMMIRDTSILREKIKDKKVLSPELTWEQRSKYLQLLNYATEDTSFIVYRSRIKYLSKKLFELLQNEECGVEDLKGLFFNKDVPLSIRLSAVRAIYMFKHFISDDEVLTAEIGKKLLRLMDEKGIDIFLIDEIVKTFGVIGYPPAADTLLYFLKNPEKYGKWNFYPGHFQEYANTRLKNTAERAILTMIRKLLMVEGPEKALALFNKAGVTNEEFERVKLEIQTKQLETRTRAWRLGKNIDDNNAVMKNTGSLFECERLCLTAI